MKVIDIELKWLLTEIHAFTGYKVYVSPDGKNFVIIWAKDTPQTIKEWGTDIKARA